MGQPRVIAAEILHDAGATLGEGPVWDDVHESVLWVDILERRVLRTSLDGRTAVACVTPSHVGAVALRRSGGLILALVDGFWELAEDAANPLPLATWELRAGIRFNDGKVDPAGRFLAGTMAYSEERGAGQLVRLDVDRTVTTLLTGVTISNGLGWSPDAETMYYIDSPTGRVDEFPYDVGSGALGTPRPFAEIPAAEGAPDGLAVDDEGGVWVAVWGAGRVQRYAPDGTLDAFVPVPATNTTSCAFVGPDRDLLVITSSREGLASEQLRREPHAGALFIASPGVRGLPVAGFGG